MQQTIDIVEKAVHIFLQGDAHRLASQFTVFTDGLLIKMPPFVVFDTNEYAEEVYRIIQPILKAGEFPFQRLVYKTFFLIQHSVELNTKPNQCFW